MRCAFASWNNCLLAAAACLLVAGCSSRPVAAPPAEPPRTVPKPATAEPPPAAPVTPRPPAPPVAGQRLRIAAVGDMMLGSDYPEDRLPDDDGAAYLAAVTPFLESADLAFGNLEGVLQDGGTPRKACDNPAACYLFRSPTRYAALFAAAGFDALSVANNHALDFGEAGRSSSMAALADAGILHSGRRGDFASLRVAKLDVAFLAFAVTRNSNLVHDYDRAFATIRAFADRHDVVVVSFHAGAEGAGTARIPFAEETYYGEPRGNVVRFARGAVDAGADFVFGHGPHVIRAAERYKERLIAYSLGNFATYYGISVAGDKGIAPILTVTVDGSGKFIEAEVISTIQHRPNGPAVDPAGRAFAQLRQLSAMDFDDAGLEFHPDGRILPAPAERVARSVVTTE